MNKTLPIILLAFTLQSCSYYTLYTGEEKKKSLTDIPLQPHNHNVDVYFNNDKPAKPYYKVQVVDTVAAEKASYEELLGNLKLKAKHEGIDGLIILEREDAVSYLPASQRTGTRKYNATTPQDAVPYQRIAAIGVKYAANIDYLETIVKSTQITVYDSESVKQVTVNFDFYGNIQADKRDKYTADFYSANIEAFDVAAHLNANVPGWEYTYDELHKIAGFRKKKGEDVLINAKVQPLVYKDICNVDYKFYIENSYKYNSYLLRFSTDNKGHIVEKRLYKQKELIWKEKIDLDGDIVKGYRRYGYTNGQEKLLFKAENAFFTTSDLPAPVTNE